MKLELTGYGALLAFKGDATGNLTGPPNVLIEITQRVGDSTPAAIRDRCYSLVQSISKRRPLESKQDMTDWITDVDTDACSIAHDAGWT